jgi:hypothetical protein
MSDHSIKITPDVTVHALLKAYPELEDVLIGIAPPFRKLKNPILRRSIARIATLKHAATVGGVPLDQLIQTLREAVGQQASGESYADQDYFGDQPEWFASEKIANSLSEADEGAEDEMPLNRVLKAGQSVAPGQIVELTATFVPAPIIEIMQSKSYLAWVCQDDETVRSYFLKPDAG